MRARQAQERRQQQDARVRAVEQARVRRNRHRREQRAEERRRQEAAAAKRRQSLRKKTKPVPRTPSLRERIILARQQQERREQIERTRRLADQAKIRKQRADQQRQEDRRRKEYKRHGFISLPASGRKRKRVLSPREKIVKERQEQERRQRQEQRQRERQLQRPVREPLPVRLGRIPTGWQNAVDHVKQKLAGVKGVQSKDWYTPIGYAPNRTKLPVYHKALELFDTPSTVTGKFPTGRMLGAEGRRIGAQIASRVWVYVLVKLPGFMKPMVGDGNLKSPSKERLDAVDRLRQYGTSRGSIFAIKALPYTFGNVRKTMEEVHETLHRRSADGEVMWKALARAWAKEDGYEYVQPVEFIGWAKGEGLVSIETPEQGRSGDDEE